MYKGDPFWLSALSWAPKSYLEIPKSAAKVCYAQIEECSQVSNQNGWFWFVSKQLIPYRCLWKFELSRDQLRYCHSCCPYWLMFRDSHEDSTKESRTASSVIWQKSLSLKKECSLILTVTLLLILWLCFQWHHLREWSLLQLIRRIRYSVLVPLLQMNQLLSSPGFSILEISKKLRNHQYQISVEWAGELIIQIRISYIPWRLFSLSLSLFFYRFFPESIDNIFLFD